MICPSLSPPAVPAAIIAMAFSLTMLPRMYSPVALIQLMMRIIIAISSRYRVLNTIAKAFCDGAACGLLDACDRRPAAALAAIDVVGQQQLEAEHDGAEQHQLEHTERFNQTIGHAGAGDRAERGAEADDDEQALAFLLGVHVVGERPELRDDHQAEDADPDEVDHRRAGRRAAPADRRPADR